MPHRKDSDRDTFTRVMVAIAVNDVEPQPTRPEIDQLGDELVEWAHRMRQEFRRAAIVDRVAKLPRAEIEARLAARLAPTACCTRPDLVDVDPPTLSDDDLRDRLVDAEDLTERMAA